MKHEITVCARIPPPSASGAMWLALAAEEYSNKGRRPGITLVQMEEP